MSIKKLDAIDSLSIMHELQAKIEKEIVQKLLIQELFNKCIRLLPSREVFQGVGIKPTAHSSEIFFWLGNALKVFHGNKEATDIINKYNGIFKEFEAIAARIYSKVIFVNGVNGEQNKIEDAKKIADQYFAELLFKTVAEIHRFAITQLPLSPASLAALKPAATDLLPLRRLQSPPDFKPKKATRKVPATAAAQAAAAPASASAPTFSLLPPVAAQASVVSSKGSGVSIFQSATATAAAAASSQPAKARREFDSRRSPVAMPIPAETQVPIISLPSAAAAAAAAPSGPAKARREFTLRKSPRLMPSTGVSMFHVAEAQDEFVFLNSRRSINQFIYTNPFPPLRPSVRLTAAAQAAAAPAPGMRDLYYSVGPTPSATTAFPFPANPIRHSQSVPETLSVFNRNLPYRIVNPQSYRTVMQSLLNPAPASNQNVKK